MADFLRRVFNIHAGEGTKVLAFTLLTVLLNAGLGLGMSAADSLFLSNVGAAHLPVVYLGAPLVLLAYIPFTVWLMGRLGKAGLFKVTLIVMAVGGVCLWAGAVLPDGLLPDRSLYYAAKIYTGVWYVALYSMLWSFIDSYFDILDAKRLFSLFAAGTSLGMMVGGAAVVGLVEFIGVEQLFLVWCATCLATLPVLAWITRRWKALDADGPAEQRSGGSFIDQWHVVVSTARQSRFLWVFGVVLVATLVINTLLEFQYMRIFETGRSEAEIAGLFGKLFFGVNAFNLVMNLFLFNRLIATIGVRNTALIQPLVYIATFSLLFVSNGFGAAVAGFFAFHGVMTSIEYNNQNFLFNALPERGKAEVRAIVEGIVEPIAVAMAGLFLVLFASNISPDTITVTGLIMAVVVFCFALALRAEYVSAMIAKLKSAWLSFSTQSDAEIDLAPDDLSLLADTARTSDTARALTAAELLWQHGHTNKAIDALARLVGGNEAVSRFDAMAVLRNMARSSAEKRRVATRILERSGGDSEMDAAIWAELARWKKSDAGPDAPRHPVVNDLSRLMEAPKSAREDILDALIGKLDGDSVEAVTPLLELVESCSGQLRVRALEALARISDPDCIPSLLNLSGQFSPAERRHVEELLVTIGLRSVPNLVSLLAESDCCRAGKSIAARALATLAFPQLEAASSRVLSMEIDRSYRYVFSESAVEKVSRDHGTMPLLSRLYRDLRHECVDYVLELLSLTGRMADYEMIGASLRSQNPKERANAIETVEQGCDRSVFKKLLPLIDGRPLRSIVEEERARMQFGRLLEAENFLVESVRRGEELESAVAFQCLCESDCKQLGLTEITGRNSRGTKALPLLREVVSSMVRGDRHEEGAPLNTFDKVNILAASAFFSSLRLTEIRNLAMEAEECAFTAGECIYREEDACVAVYIVVEGEVESVLGLLGQGQLLGRECLSGAGNYRSDAFSCGTRLLRIPQAAIWSASCVFPNIAVALLHYQLEEAHVA